MAVAAVAADVAQPRDVLLDAAAQRTFDQDARSMMPMILASSSSVRSLARRWPSMPASLRICLLLRPARRRRCREG